MGCQVREPYVNGGVILYADTLVYHRFADAWHRNRLAGQCGVHRAVLGSAGAESSSVS